MNLIDLAARVATHPGLLSKQSLQAVAAALGGDGDDAAVLPMPAGGSLVTAAEAIVPSLVRDAPRVAGIAGVVAVLNDIAACGGRPVALLDTVVGSEETVREVLDGVRSAADRYGVAVVGGHTTIDDQSAGLSTMAIGHANAPLRAANARPGDALVLITCLDGQLVRGAGGVVMFSHLRGGRADRAADDLDLLPRVAEAGVAWAARDISMPGLGGSLVQFLDSAGGELGCVLDVDAIPVPVGVTIDDWLAAFPSFGFLVAGDPAGLVADAHSAGLTAARVGTFDSSGRLMLRRGDEVAQVWDLSRQPLTGMGASSTP